jgi:hypothetical protein
MSTGLTAEYIQKQLPEVNGQACNATDIGLWIVECEKEVLAELPTTAYQTVSDQTLKELVEIKVLIKCSGRLGGDPSVMERRYEKRIALAVEELSRRQMEYLEPDTRIDERPVIVTRGKLGDYLE